MTAQTDLFDGLYEDVLSLTNRPDLSAETMVAIRTATLAVHSDMTYLRDLVSQIVRIPNPAFVFQVDHTQTMPRLRGISTCQFLDAAYNPMTVPNVDVIEVGDIKDPEYGTLRNDVCYLAGTSINVRASMAIYGVLVEYYQLPLVRREQYNSWIAQLAPDAIVFKAAAVVFGTNGNEEKSANYNRMYEQQLKPNLIANFATGAMR